MVEVETPIKKITKMAKGAETDGAVEALDNDFLKTRVEDLNFSTRVAKALAGASIRTAGGLSRKHGSDLLTIDGLGEKGIKEIKDVLSRKGIALKD